MPICIFLRSTIFKSYTALTDVKVNQSDKQQVQNKIKFSIFNLFMNMYAVYVLCIYLYNSNRV